MIADVELGQFLPYTEMPLVRAGTEMPRSPIVADSQLFDIRTDPGQI